MEFSHFTGCNYKWKVRGICGKQRSQLDTKLPSPSLERLRQLALTKVENC